MIKILDGILALINGLIKVCAIIFIGLLIIFIGYAFLDHESSDKDKLKNTDLREVAQHVVDSTPMGLGWRALEIHEIKDGEISFNLYYNQDPSAPESDSESITQRVLDALVAAGHRPSSERITVFVTAEQDGLKTVTGEPGVTTYGMAHYDPNDDRIVWTPYDQFWTVKMGLSPKTGE